MMFVILLMIVAVAAFNIVATLVMIVKRTDRHRHPAHPGRRSTHVLLTFAVQGVLIGLAGTLLGAALGTRSPTTCSRWWARSSICLVRSSSTRGCTT